jgi:hypothetical protein
VKKSVGLWFIALLALFASASCNPPADYALVGSAFVPAAHGDVHIERIDKQQILVVIAMDHLPSPAEVEPGMTHFVVWFNAVGEYPALQGTLEYDPETRTGRASIPTDMREFDVQITAERTETPTEPSDILVASQKIREK